MGPVVLDSSVVLATLIPTDTHHAAAIAAVRERESVGAAFLLPSLVLAEVLVGRARWNPEGVDSLRASVIDAFGAVRVLDEEVAVAAAHLRAAHPSLRMPDAVVLATGIVDGCSAILTADRRWSTLDPRVVVVGAG